MGAFNTLEVEASCPNCGTVAELSIQFKYGETWQHSYRLGDRLQWGRNDHGFPGMRKVEVLGTMAPCPSCGKDDADYMVLIKNDVLVGIDARQRRL